MTYEYFLNRSMDEIFDTTKHDYYLALSTTAPAANGTGITEPSTSGTGYTRMKIANFTDSAKGVVTNAESIIFPETTNAWGVVTHYAVFDALTGGHPLYSDALKNSRPLTGPVMQLTFLAGELKMTLRDAAAN